jgi:hypothetical protein
MGETTGSARTRPASFFQERMLRLSIDEHDYDVTACVWRARGVLDRERCEAAVALLARRHEVLRTKLDTVGESVVQVVTADPSIQVEFLRLPARLPATAHRTIERLAHEEAARPVPLRSAGWASVLIVAHDSRETFLIWRFGHAAWDEYSSQVLLQDFVALYESPGPDSAPTLTPLGMQFGDVAATERSVIPPPATAAFWSRTLERALASVSRDCSSTPGRYSGASLRLPSLGSEEAGVLRSVARASGSTPAIALMALWACVLAAEKASEGVVLAVFEANREEPGRELLIGCVANLLLVHIPVPRANSWRFAEVIKAARDAMFGAYDAKIPVQQQLSCIPDALREQRSPLFADALFNYHPGGGAQLRETQVRERLLIERLPFAPTRRVLARGPWTGTNIGLNGASRAGGGLELWLSYDEHAQDLARATRLGERFAAIARRVLRSPDPLAHPVGQPAPTCSSGPGHAA